jgi:hypothetical protein
MRARTLNVFSGACLHPALPILLLLFLICSCANTSYRFEKADGSGAPVLNFDGLYGVRDGAVVQAEGRFTNAADSVTMDVTLYLRPPAEFQSGTYRATIGGRTTNGVVDCPSLIFQGGQTALPTVGGTFVLKDENNQPIYRITIPATQLKRAASLK